MEKVENIPSIVNNELVVFFVRSLSSTDVKIQTNAAKVLGLILRTNDVRILEYFRNSNYLEQLTCVLDQKKTTTKAVALYSLSNFLCTEDCIFSFFGNDDLV